MSTIPEAALASISIPMSQIIDTFQEESELDDRITSSLFFALPNHTKTVLQAAEINATLWTRRVAALDEIERRSREAVEIDGHHYCHLLVSQVRHHKYHLLLLALLVPVTRMS
jgi:hypothetical protein